jgi:hypothetical protein
MVIVKSKIELMKIVAKREFGKTVETLSITEAVRAGQLVSKAVELYNQMTRIGVSNFRVTA